MSQNLLNNIIIPINSPNKQNSKFLPNVTFKKQQFNNLTK